jgi:hypothetical protein
MTLWDFMDRHPYVGSLTMTVVTFWASHHIVALGTSWAMAVNSWANAYATKWGQGETEESETDGEDGEE